MKILFIYLNTGNRGSYPIGLTNLATYIKSQGHDVEIFDTTFYKQFTEEGRDNIRVKVGIYKPVDNPMPTVYNESDLNTDLLQKIEEFRPDIIGFSILSAQFYFSLGMSAKLKEVYPEMPIIYGGLHPSIAPEETIRQDSVDMICIGEGEYAIAELLDKMSDRKDITGIKNLWVKQNGKIYKNGLRELVNLDELPVLNWDFFSEQHQNTPLNGHMYKAGPVEFSRGCPYSCNYCSCTALRNLTKPQKYLRRKSIDKAI
ncbi:MAG TPA: hypothetical protein ENG80_00260, partial [Nitrospirae bacterium]|nr:hypothetical protein [Nitrospirota bacterium]